MSQAGLSNINSAVVGGAEQFGLPDSSIITPTGSPLEVDFQNGNGITIQQGTNNHNIKIGLSSPNAVISDFDDFIDEIQGSLGFGKLGWLINSSGLVVSQVTGTSTNPGILPFGDLGPGSGGYVVLETGTNALAQYTTGCWVLGGGKLSVNWVLDLVALSNNTNSYNAYIGIMDSFSPTQFSPTPVNGCYFKYNHNVNGGNWQVVCTSSSVSTVNNTITPAVTGFVNYGIVVNSNSTSVSFFINGVEVANSPINSNIPTTQLVPAIYIPTLAGTSPISLVDLFYYIQILNTPR